MRIVGVWAVVAGLCLIGCGDDDTQANNNTDGGPPLSCGDGELQGLEECDEGSDNSDTEPNACRTDCRLAHCGDGVVDNTEECDRGPANADGVPDACRPGCTDPVCGDLVVDVQHGETCDDGNTAEGDGCSDVCEVEYCGNGILDPGETCDDGNLEGGDGCSPDCFSNETCGNGHIDLAAGENCDGSDLGNADCELLGFYSGTLSCDPSSCLMDISTCTNCIDLDSDKFGEGPACFGIDCDEGDGSCYIGHCCMSGNRCWDGDGDGYGNYPGCLGPDCDETNDQCHTFGDSCCPAENGNAGQACTDDSQCSPINSSTGQCLISQLFTDFPGGYCSVVSCPEGTNPDPCAAIGGVCVPAPVQARCVKPCTTPSDCRVGEGYTCLPQGYCWYTTIATF